MKRAAAALAVIAVGCGGSTRQSQPTPAPHKLLPGESVVRGWTEALYAGDYKRAAHYFARGAIVQQSQTVVLDTYIKALAFNLSLPCRAKVTRVVQEPRGVLLASFKLFPGPGGCARGGNARVRFFIRRGKIESWHQLPDAPAPPGEST